jgi:hypothetical protein
MVRGADGHGIKLETFLSETGSCNGVPLHAECMLHEMAAPEATNRTESPEFTARYST